MNENLVKNPSISSEERSTEWMLPPAEELPDTLAGMLSQIVEIQDRKEVSTLDAVVSSVAERLQTEPFQMEAARSAVNFTERAVGIEEKKKTIRARFEEGVRRSLLPVAATLMMNTSPVLAQEARVNRSATALETPSIVKTEVRELMAADVFDFHSPLAITGEKMKTLKREMLPGELLVVKDFQNKVWQEKNEWMTVSGEDETGKFLSEAREMGALGGEQEFDILEDIEKNGALIHTHPVEAGEILRLSPVAIRSGEIRPFIMAPSAADVGQCMGDAGNGRVERIVDPVGMWEYRCDENHPFVHARKKFEEELNAALEGVKARYHVQEDDVVQIGATLGSVHPAFMILSFFSELNKKYPGIENDSTAVIGDIVGKNIKFALSLSEFESEGNELSHSSVTLSDVDLAKKIQGFIQNAEKKGIYMSYAPFRKPTKMKEGKEIPIRGVFRGDEVGEK